FPNNLNCISFYDRKPFDRMDLSRHNLFCVSRKAYAPVRWSLLIQPPSFVRPRNSLCIEPVAKLFGTPLTSHNLSQIEAMYLDSIQWFSRQYSKIFRFTVGIISV